MEIPSALGALVVIFGLAYWVNSRREKKEKVAINEKLAKVERAKSSELQRKKNETSKIIRSRALELGVDYTDEELNWICNKAMSNSGKKGLDDIGKMFATAPKDKLGQLIMKMEKEHLMYFAEQHVTRLSDEAERKWKALLENFIKLNSAQQKSHLAYIKKNHKDELTDEQLHTLELIILSEANT